MGAVDAFGGPVRAAEDGQIINLPAGSDEIDYMGEFRF